MIRTGGSPAALASEARDVVRQGEPEAVIDRMEPLTTAVPASLEAPRFAAVVVASFASVAVALAAVGLYGVLSYTVSQRNQELGIRAALGAQRVDLARLLLGEAQSVILVGIPLGVLGASLFTRLMQDLLFGVTPLDAVAFAMAPAILVVAALAACLGPALRAASTDPATTLRAQ